jgi:plasmid stabilization system protein ParE
MDNKFNVYWSDEAIRNLDGIVEYLSSNWSKKEITRFLKKLDKAILLIAQRPELFPTSKYKQEMRRLVLTKQISIIYSHKDNTIHIISLFDNRQDPDRL